MLPIKEIKQSFFVSLWMVFLTFPIMVIRVNTIYRVVEWRWEKMIYVGAGTFIASFFYRYLINKKEHPAKQNQPAPVFYEKNIYHQKKAYIPLMVAGGLFAAGFPFIFSMYQTNILISALIYVVVGLGLNIVVGLAGLLDLGYVAFYAIGAYSYGLLNHHFGIGFWAALPIGGILGFLSGIILGFPVLRLRGDYLAIVTLGFGEIIRLILENWNAFSFGPSGIANIPGPGFFGMQLSLRQMNLYIYYLMLGLVLLAVFVVSRLKNSRTGRAWMALREDEIACEAMGIDRTKTKLTAFALGATWAGMGGVIFAAKTTFINPACFTIWESIIILCIVVLGGMGSIPGVLLGAMILILLPEYLRAFSEYRMLIFGAVLVFMMIVRPGGIIRLSRQSYALKKGIL
jgi:branched-chain amino acid transport system permease protein